MIPQPHVWVFVGARNPSGVFSSRDKAEEWIKLHGLSGTLTVLPLDQGCFDWAVEQDVLTMKPEKVEIRKTDPQFIGDCLPASFEHFHYEDGKEQ